MIWEKLTPELIFMEMKAKKDTEVLQNMAIQVVKSGYGDAFYTPALLERERNFPTGLNINGFGISIAHTDTHYVKKDCVAFARLKRPVPFIHMGTERERVNVSLVFIMSVSDPEKQMTQLQRLLTVVQDTDVLQKLTDAQDVLDVTAAIREKESTLRE